MKRAHSHISDRCLRRAALALTLIGLLLIPMGELGAAQPSDATMRFGFSHSLFGKVKENEARAAIEILASRVARQRKVPAPPQAVLFKNTEEMATALKNRTVDMVAVSVLEYEKLQRQTPFGTILFPTKTKETSEEYVLVSHKEGPVQSLADLAGRHILIYQNILQCLAPLWLDTLLIDRGLAPIESLTGKVERNGNILEILLPVFFRQADACLVSRRSLETTIEMNPQLGRQLQVLESSPPMVPIVFAFRRDYTPSFKEGLLEALRSLHETEDGRQILMFFKISQFEEHSKPLLDATLELISYHSRLLSR